ncbi:MAG: hypothetical protein IPL90_00470 [Holophagales bacterium]|nr:hypothetical protein [Holophagales bacterium]
MPILLVLFSLADGAALGDELATRLKLQVNEVLAGQRPLAEVTLDVVGGRPDRRSLTVYGSGVGIWNREKQFALTPDEHKELLKSLVASGLFEMPERPKPARSVEMNPPVVVRAVGVKVGDLERVVSQNDRVWALPALETLVADLFKLCGKAASTGTGASTLADGLEKVAKGKLAPETLLVVLNIPPVAASASAPAANGVLAVLDGGALKWTDQAPGKPAEAVPTPISAERLRSLAALLAEAGFDKLPPNLYRERYVDLRANVLNRVHSIQARKFAGLDSSKSLPQQKALEKIIEAVLALGPQGQGRPPGVPAAGKPEGALP